MAAKLGADSHDSANDDGDGGALALSVLYDLLGLAAFLASHPLHAAYALFLSRHLLPLLAFFCPLLVSTSLLLAVLVTLAPYFAAGGSPERPGAGFLGRTCGIAVGALCAELRPNGAAGGGVGLVGQLCSFVLGPGDAAAALRVGEIMGELCDIGDSCFVLLGAEDYSELAVELPFPLEGGDGDKIFLDHENLDDIKDGIEEKNVVCENLKEEFKVPDYSPPEHSCPGEASMQDQKEDSIQGQRLSMADLDGFSDGVKEKRLLDCDPVPVEIKKCEVVKPLSSVSRRIKQWEAHASGDLKRILDEMEEENPEEFRLEKGSFKDVKECVQLETKASTEKCGEKLPAQEIVQQQEEEEQGFKDVKECFQSETEASTENCCQGMHAEEELAEQSHKVVQPEQELGEKDYKDAQSEQELQDQPAQGLQEQEYDDVKEESAVMTCDGKESSFKPTSIARRVHSRTSSENLVGEGSPRREKEWKRTLACKLYEERMQLRLCRDRAVVECSTDNMDMLWEAYESGGGGAAGDAKRGRGKAKGASSGKKQGELAEEGEQVAAVEEEEDDEDGDEGSVRQLCCLQALKFSTRKMNLGGGKPSLAKISKVLKRMTALSRVGSRRGVKG